MVYSIKHLKEIGLKAKYVAHYKSDHKIISLLLFTRFKSKSLIYTVVVDYSYVTGVFNKAP